MAKGFLLELVKSSVKNKLKPAFISFPFFTKYLINVPGVFFKNKDGELHTPIPDSFLDGITRREVMKIAISKGIKVIERKIKPEEMKNFVGCFLTGTAAEVTPVSQINDYKFKVCNLISDLNDEYQNLVRKESAA